MWYNFFTKIIEKPISIESVLLISFIISIRYLFKIVSKWLKHKKQIAAILNENDRLAYLQQKDILIPDRIEYLPTEERVKITNNKFDQYKVEENRRFGFKLFFTIFFCLLIPIYIFFFGKSDRTLDRTENGKQLPQPPPKTSCIPITLTDLKYPKSVDSVLVYPCDKDKTDDPCKYFLIEITKGYPIKGNFRLIPTKPMAKCKNNISSLPNTVFPTYKIQFPEGCSGLDNISNKEQLVELCEN